MYKRIVHDFPLPHIHLGTTVGNGELGLSVWGEDRIVNISVGVSSLWDHRGGMEWSDAGNLRALRRAWARNDEAAIRKMFASGTGGDPRMLRPSHVPLGRLVLTLPAPAERVELDIGTGLIRVFYAGKSLAVVVSSRDKHCFALRLPEEAGFEVVPAFRLSAALRDIGYVEPATTADGFFQPMPSDPGFQLGARRFGDELRCRFRRGDAAAKLDFSLGFAAIKLESADCWRRFWKHVPQLKTPNPLVDELFTSGLFKFEAMTAADGTPAGLQGPWLEDDALPPWSGDYHFNINVQMCYQPAYASGRWENLLPLFRMVLSWRDKLRRNARCFVGIDDGCMLPHSVDDRGVCMGGFWTGCVDHASSAWMAQMMFDYVRYSGDTGFLRDGAWDFMVGVMKVYLAMLEEEDGRLVLPFGVSPEYRGDCMDAVGRNPSFQLAAIHRLARDLIAGAEMLGLPADPAWLRIETELPALTTWGEAGHEEIAVWDGVPLEESHRHHSHLAALCPFNTISADAEAWRDVVVRSRNRWIAMGMGKWAGWSIPWAVMLHNRFGNPEMAEFLIGMWGSCYRNRGGGSCHDPVFRGVSLIGGDRRIMQMDAAMGIVAAIADLFVYECAGVLYALHGVPDAWDGFSVEGLCCPGGFVLSARRKNGRTTIRVRAARDGDLALDWRGRLYRRTLRAGEECRFVEQPAG